MFEKRRFVTPLFILPVVFLLYYEFIGQQRIPHSSVLRSAVNLNSLKRMTHFDSLNENEIILHRSRTHYPITRPTTQSVPIHITEKYKPDTDVLPLNTRGDPFEALWIDPKGSFEVRLDILNQYLSEIRNEYLLSNISDWKDVAQSLNVLWLNLDGSMLKIADYPEIITLALKWKNDDSNKSVVKDNSLVESSFMWTGSRSLCYMIQTPSYTRAHWDAVYQRKCDTDINMTAVSIELEPLYFNGRPINKDHYWPNEGLHYPDYYYSQYPRFVLYIHMFGNGIVTGLGDVISKDLKFLPYSCSQDLDPRPPRGYEKTDLHEEVFVVTQYWGESFFHKMIESLPRIAPYMSFLKSNPDIKIHVAELGGYTNETLNFLGLETNRLITGVVRAKRIYLPQATPCGFSQAQSTQLLSKLYRERIKEKFNLVERNSVVLIKRSGSRRFTYHDEIQRKLEHLSGRFGMKFVLFSDSPVPPMEEAMQIFNQAVLIVGPHGAGLSNMIYSEPGTYILEAVCNPPHVNMCFQWTAHVLGHHYYGMPSRRGCERVIDVDPDELATAAENLLRISKLQI